MLNALEAVKTPLQHHWHSSLMLVHDTLFRLFERKATKEEKIMKKLKRK